MGANSKIEWCSHTFNPWLGCQKVSPGCDHCYAEAMMDHRYGKVQWGPHGERKRTTPQNWRQPKKWNAAAVKTGQRVRVFCASLSDVFDNRVPELWRKDLFDLIWETPMLDWLLLTKRPENMAKMLPWKSAPWSHVWLGTTCEDQAAYDRRWPILRDTPATIRFISYEPAIGPLALPEAAHPDWIICGGESGPHARYMEPEWAYVLLAQCQYYGVRFFMKQMTGKKPIPAALMLREVPA